MNPSRRLRFPPIIANYLGLVCIQSLILKDYLNLLWDVDVDFDANFLTFLLTTSELLQSRS